MKDIRELMKLGVVKKTRSEKATRFEAVSLTDSEKDEIQKILEEEYKVLGKADFKKAHARIIVTRLLSTVRREAMVSKYKGEEFVLAIDTDIGNIKDFAKELFEALKEMQDLLAKEGLDNIRVFMGDGMTLSAQLKTYFNEAARGKKKFIVSAIVKKEHVEKRLYHSIEDKLSITSVDDSKLPNVEENGLSYIPILQIVELAIKNATGTSSDVIRQDYSNLANVEKIIEKDGMIIVILLPRAKPVPVNGLIDRYRNEARVLLAA